MPKQKLQITNLLIQDSSVKNPFSGTPDRGALENMVPNYGKLVRAPFMPPFHSSVSSSQVWKVFDFQFTRDGARNQQILIFKANGKIYKRIAGTELEIFPGKTTLAVLNQKPMVINVADRLHVSDGSQYVIYDGWDWFTGGLVAPAAPSCALVGGALTGTYKVAVTAVHIRNGVRIHESSRSAVTSNTPAAQNIRVTKPTLDARATHWSIYMSELSTSDVYRRVATIAVTSTTTDISAVPVSTSPIAPIRNDPLLPSRVMCQWKNRIAMRDEAAQSNLWFTAFAEVKGLLNGAAEECLPGRGSASISDLVNSWTLPDSGEPMLAAVWHEEYLWVFSNRNGYLIRGEGSLLDNRGIRDFFPVHMFSFGGANSTSLLSSPYGLIVLTNERNLSLWKGEGETVDIGRDIQDRLNSLTDVQLNNAEMQFWDGGGNDWLVIALGDRIGIFDFGTRTDDSPDGVWFSVGTQGGLPAPSTIGQVNLNGMQLLVAGFIDGSVRVIDTDQQRSISVHQPAHLGLSMKLGQTYLGATVQSSPTAIARTGSFQPTEGSWTEGQYIEIFHKGTGDTDATGIRPASPTVNVYFDDINPYAPDGPISIVPQLLSSTREKRAWLTRTAGTSQCGALAKRFQFELQISSTTTDGATRPQCVNDEVWMFGFGWIPRGDLVL
jgi:hypothetical protein